MKLNQNSQCVRCGATVVGRDIWIPDDMAYEGHYCATCAALLDGDAIRLVDTI